LRVSHERRILANGRRIFANGYGILANERRILERNYAGINNTHTESICRQA
jgi:hypothetical protein